MSTSSSTKKARRIKKPGQPHQYWVTATQYYVLGRYAVFCSFLPVTGNLFHHAVELMLKNRLLDTYSQADLARPPFSHSLLRLWQAFKSRVGDPSLGRFDSLIRRVNKWEDVRYPAFPRGAQAMSIEMRKGHRVVHSSPTGQDIYRVNLEEIDELFATLVIACDLNPTVVLQRIGFREAGREAYEKENYHRL